jgi:CDP-alcohol phosphatidyltransferase-like enzyme
LIRKRDLHHAREAARDYRATVTRQGRGWLGNRDVIERSADGRRFVDEILNDLTSRHFAPLAWGDFLGRSLSRSVAQIRIRPAAATEVTVVHLLASARNRWWTFGSWLMCITHLGLLGERATLGWPNRLTLLRALLPSLAPNSRWTSLVAMATDLADGRIARRGEESAFGAFADPIADGVFWSWFALRWESNRGLRWVPLTVFAASVAGISAAYFARGRAIDYPRLAAIRYASAAAQILFTLRALRAVGR